MSLVLDAAQLSRVFGKGENTFTAVDRVSLRVSSGEIHALLGPNGAGKTTTVQMCSTLLTPTSGSLTVKGVDAIAHPQRARRHVGLALGGENGFYPRASARDNLLFFADVAGVSGRARRHEVEHALARVELTDAAARPVQEFSRGMKQRLHIARALLGSPPCSCWMSRPTGSTPISP
ncbi:ABC transporter ATP-binding protein [Rothia mucilaginosa]|uniref:ABC transporter ATP-binding protein n=1 Tax=Rothia mucilaginosa TaxID=43675 RepID=UPI002053471A|nr:ABC transporter ATP-binding protein [Rothia mucilaginosa]UQF82609.1 MAG: ABC transporter ATP-binding protein [Rothia mucilaginosa]